MSIFDRVDVRTPDECWEWTGSRSSDGYGSVRRRGRAVGTHRVAWEEANGPIPGGLHVLHSCDNPPCCNPAHLSLGTHAENQRQKALRGRGRTGPRQGAHNPMSKLDDEAVRAIRRRLAEGAYQRVVAAEFGISQSNVSLIARGEAWPHVAHLKEVGLL